MFTLFHIRFDVLSFDTLSNQVKLETVGQPELEENCLVSVHYNDC